MEYYAPLYYYVDRNSWATPYERKPNCWAAYAAFGARWKRWNVRLKLRRDVQKSCTRSPLHEVR